MPYYSPSLGRWLFIRPQPKPTRRTPKRPKIGRWLLVAALFYYWARAIAGAL